jgi:hypothetical protein
MARGDELDRAVEQRIHDVDVLFAWNAEDIFDSFVLEASYKQLRGCSWSVAPGESEDLFDVPDTIIPGCARREHDGGHGWRCMTTNLGPRSPESLGEGRMLARADVMHFLAGE